jgi:predicted Zn-dependent peptidase
VFIVLVTALLLFASSGNAVAAGSEPIERTVLPDGVRLVLKPEPATDITAITLFIRTPRDRDVQEKACGEMVAHTLFYGSTDSTRDGIAFSVAQVGGVLETLRTPDYVAVTVMTVPDQIEETARLLGEALKHADFTPDALQRGLRDILAARKVQSENGFEAGAARIRTTLDTIASPTEDQLRRVTQAQAQSYFVARYVPARTVVSVVGRFAAKSVLTAFMAYFAEYTRPAATRQIDPAPAVTVSTPHTSETVLSATGTAGYALIGVAAPTIDSPDAPAYILLHALIGSGHASRLFRNVRDTLGFGYDIGAVYRSDLPDPMIAYLQWDTQRAEIGGAVGKFTSDEALQRLNRELDRVLTDPPDDAEIERARNVAIGRDALRHERARDRSFFLGWYECIGVGYEFDVAFPRLLSTVTRTDILRVAAKYLPQRSAVTVMPKKR